MTPEEFIAKWTHSNLRERQAYVSHFNDLCDLLGHPKPAESDPDGSRFTFDRGLRKRGGGLGYADVWKKGFFAWEYKGKKHKDLDAAYDQLLSYHEALDNPPLLVICDFDRFIIYPKFPGYATKANVITLEDLVKPEVLQRLRWVFAEPDRWRPDVTIAALTEGAVGHFGQIADSLRVRCGPEKTAHFLIKLVFCCFAQNIGLLPKGLFTSVIDKAQGDGERFARNAEELFAVMAKGGDFWGEDIEHFDGGLFEDHEVLALSKDEMKRLAAAANEPWEQIEPAIFGTLFERCIDPAQRSQLGLHYTSPKDIRDVIEPVLMRPLRREWASVQEKARALHAEYFAAKAASGEAETRLPARALKSRRASNPSNGSRAIFQAGPAREKLKSTLTGFIHRLAFVRVLDPACGSGNFLYIALQELKNLEHEVINFAVAHDLPEMEMHRLVGPHQLLGIETNAFAWELASAVVWIGQIKWTIDHGRRYQQIPVLKPLNTIRRGDAILDFSRSNVPAEPNWTECDVIVGNPPFLGGKFLRRELNDEYVDALFKVWGERVPPEADLSAYWHEKARAQIEKGDAKRAGLLATQAIRGGANRTVLERIKKSGDIFEAWADREWTLAGAAVHISIVCQDDGTETERHLDGQPVAEIHANLTVGGAEADTTTARRLKENAGIAFMGTTKQGPFDIDRATAEQLWRARNADGRSNRAVVRPWRNGKDITSRAVDHYIIDLDALTKHDAALYEAPFEYVRANVKPWREKRKRAWFREQWWQLYARRPEMYGAINGKKRFIVTARVAKHRLFVWLTPNIIPDCQLIVFARDDDYFFGVLHSKIHEWWALALGTQLREKESGFRYTPTTTFETFPFPWPPNTPRARYTAEQKKHESAVAAAAKELNDLRNGWLNPPNLDEKELKKRTLTNLYNQRPMWLALTHAALDRAVLSAYGWSDLADALTAKDEDRRQSAEQLAEVKRELLARLLGENGKRGL
ncbi:MAG: class I SAM-dependent DNA methyltransferase [Planctomycetes bacterium]|nr:class I SAM-dependent DNA methyltransferase [Planctomycetota bacterium]